MVVVPPLQRLSRAERPRNLKLSRTKDAEAVGLRREYYHRFKMFSVKTMSGKTVSPAFCLLGISLALTHSLIRTSAVYSDYEYCTVLSVYVRQRRVTRARARGRPSTNRRKPVPPPRLNGSENKIKTSRNTGGRTVVHLCVCV